MVNFNKIYGFVYCWTNKINFKWYIGSHRGTPNDGYIGSGKHFKKAVVKYGLENFERIIIYEGLYYREHEEEILQLLNASEDCRSYNLKNCSKGIPIGYKHSLDHNKKISEARKGVPRSEETKRKLSAKNKGKRSGAESVLYGIPRLNSVKEKVSKANKGKKRTEEVKKKLSLSRTGKKRSSYIKVKCPHCDKYGTTNNMKRWHFDNCSNLQKNESVSRKKEKIKCPHCEASMDIGNIKKLHFDNCKYKNSKAA